MLKKFVFAGFSTLLVLCVVAMPVTARAVPVHVAANGEWVDSGFDVEVGETYSFKTNGKVRTIYPPSLLTGPEGQIYICSNDNEDGPDGEALTCALDGAPFGALIGKIGDEGESFLIGDDISFEAEVDGRLYLAINDYEGTYFDNYCGFTVIFK